MSLKLGALIGLGATDEKAKVSATDTTAGYLNGKLVAGSGITFTQNNTGANETLTIASSATPSIGGAITGGTQYSVLFVDGAGIIAQDNTNLNFNNSTNTLTTANLNISGLTAGSVLFAGASGAVSQDNANIFYDDTNNYLGLGVNTSLGARLHIKGEGATSANSALLVANSTTDIFKIRNDGAFFLGLGASNTEINSIAIGRIVSVSGAYNTLVGATASNSAGTNHSLYGYGVTSAGSSNSIFGSSSTNGSGSYNTLLGYNNVITSGNYHTIVGANISATNGANEVVMMGNYNRQVNDYCISIATYDAAYTNRMGTNDIFIGAYINYNSNYSSGGSNVMIGAYQNIDYSAGLTNSVMIGRDVQARVDATASKGYNVSIGCKTRLGNSSANIDHGILILGTGTGAAYLTNNENDSLIIGMNDAYESFKLYKRGVFVFNGANAASVVDGTNCDSSATNTIAMVSGTAPVTAVSNTAQIFSNDSGQLSYLDENGFTIGL